MERTATGEARRGVAAGGAPAGAGVSRPSLARFAWLSIAVASVNIGAKSAAWLLTGSVGLFADAAESIVNLVAAVVTLWMLVVAARPPDEDHAFGHSKAEYFASGVEGALILVAASGIVFGAVRRLLEPRPLERLGVGLLISFAAAALNLGAARVLFRAARTHRSIALEADAHHLMTDVWTSVAVLAGIGLVALTGWDRLDPLVALVAAANIVRSGFDLVRRSTLGLLDTAMPAGEQQALDRLLDRHRGPTVQFHAVRTRQAGARRFISMHVLVPGDWSVRRGHDLLETLEREIAAAFPSAAVFTHLEALEDPSSFEDQEFDRPAGP
ncbi:MAG TPA: cation diffusion facilitator family transporter [Anaeromyxobacter sp.]|nr:cation diffusion facilitator family transporter [Anaeromyxobacter sp.]